MKSSDQTSNRLRATLRTKADDIDPPVRDFDPNRRVDLDLHDLPDRPDLAMADRPHHFGSNRRVLFGAAAAVAVLAVASIGYMASSRRGTPAVVHTVNSAAAPTTVPPATGGLLPLAPTWVPDGFQLWSIDTMPDMSSSKFMGKPMPTMASSGTTPSIQRFQATDDPTRLIQVQVLTVPSWPSGAGVTEVMVRGQHGIGLGSAGRDAVQGAVLSWKEDGVQIAAFGDGVDTTALVAFLDGLSWRSTDPFQGFALPNSGTWALTLDQRGGAAVVPASPALEFTYVDPTRTDKSGQPYRFEVWTVKANAFGETGISRPFYPDGFAFSPDGSSFSPDGSSLSYFAAGNRVLSTTADHRSANVTSPNWAMSQADLTRVATSIAPADAAQVAKLRRDADAAVVAHIPVVASGSLASKTEGPVIVELRGMDGKPNVICLAVHGDHSCGARNFVSTSGTPVVANLMVDGTWLVAAAAPATNASTGAAQAVAIYDGDSNGGEGEAPLPGAVHARAGGWALTLVEPGTSVGSYDVEIGGESVGGALRPAT